MVTRFHADVGGGGTFGKVRCKAALQQELTRLDTRLADRQRRLDELGGAAGGTPTTLLPPPNGTTGIPRSVAQDSTSTTPCSSTGRSTRSGGLSMRPARARTRSR